MELIMQSTIPEEVLPPEELETDLYLTQDMQDLYEETENAADLVFGDAPDEQTAVIHDDGQLTYGDLREQINRFGNLLIEKGVEPGERVLIQFGNTAAFTIANYAIQKINAIPVPISPMNTEDDIEYIIEDARATWTVTTPEKADTYTNLPVTLITLPADLDEYSDELDARGEPDDLALLLYTSGTTGDPKGTVKTHRELVADGEILAKSLRLTADDTISGTAPISFAMGYLVFNLTPFRRGATVSLTNDRDPQNIVDRVQTDNITIFSAVPTSYNKILDVVDTDTDLSSLRICMTGGEELKQHTYDRWQDTFGLRLDNHYGCSELLTIALYQYGDDMTPCANGTPPEDLDVTLFDTQDTDTEDDTDKNNASTPTDTGELATAKSTGELAVKAPVRVRYWNNTTAQEDAVRDGYFLMGDIFEKDDSGEYNFKCRKDNLIVTSGYKVSANEVENALLDHPHVEDAAVIGAPDRMRGQRITAYVVSTNELDGERGKGELQGYTKARIAPYKYPRDVIFVDSIPKTDVGKVDRTTLKDMAQD